tara:strand:- start:236 stop:829 length:594 start_codon:yes stop_codon:yes gene_type:complete
MKPSLDKSIKYFIFIRHFSTKWNEANKLQGVKDINIKKIDKKKVLKLQNKINNIKKNFNEKNINYFSSNLKRSKQTALKLSFKNLNINNNLNEYNFGKFEGLDKKKSFSKLKFDKRFCKIHGNEEKKSILQRIETFLGGIQTKSLNICIVHGMWLRFLYLSLKKKNIQSLFRTNLPNGCIVTLVFKNKMNYKIKLLR